MKYLSIALKRTLFIRKILTVANIPNVKPMNVLTAIK